MTLLRSERERRARGERFVEPERRWALGYAGRASEFIGEIVGPAWFGPDWLAWRSFVKTLFGEEMDGEETAVFRSCTGLEEPPPGRQRVAWVPAGRRGGKSRMEALIGVHLACCYDYSPYLAPGEVGTVVAISDSREHAGAIMRYAKAALAHPELRGLVVRDLRESVELRGSVEIEVVTASLSAVRSRTTLAALLDEIAFWQPDETMANPDVEIIRSLRPSMLTIPNALQLGASSRYARKGVLWEAFKNHHGRPGGELVWSADTITMHPGVDRAALGVEYERDPIAAAAEYGTEWREDLEDYVSIEVIHRATVAGRAELPPDPIGRILYRAFVDPSGGSRDSFTLAIGHAEGERIVIDLVRERRAPFAPDQVTDEFCALVGAYRLNRVTGDRYAGEWPRERFAAHGVTYEQSELTKSEIYGEFLPLMNSGRADMLDNPRIEAQLLGLKRRRVRGGRDSVDHGPNGYDDLINAVAGVATLIARDRAGMVSWSHPWAAAPAAGAIGGSAVVRSLAAARRGRS